MIAHIKNISCDLIWKCPGCNDKKNTRYIFYTYESPGNEYCYQMECDSCGYDWEILIPDNYNT